MPRYKARVTHDEIVRMIKGVRSAGLEIGMIRLDAAGVVTIVIADDDNDRLSTVDNDAKPLREPVL